MRRKVEKVIRNIQENKSIFRKDSGIWKTM